MKLITRLPQSQYNLVELFFKDLDTFFDKSFPDYPKTDVCRSIDGYPVANMFTNSKGDLKLEIAVTGFNEDQLKIDVADGFLTITGEVKEEEETEWALVYGKLKHTTFNKRYKLSSRLDMDKISAKVKDGMLSIIIESKEETQPKQIPILKD